MPDYAIDVAVEPDASRFPEQLAAAVGKAEARQDPIEIELEPKVGREFQREAQRKVKAAIAKLDAEVTLAPKVARSFRRDVQKLAKEAVAGQAIEIPVTAVLGRGFRRDLQRQAKEATTGAEISIPVQAKLGPGFRAKLQKTVREALTAKPIEASVALSVNKRAVADFTKDVVQRTAEATEAARLSGAADVRLGVDATGLDARVLAEVGAATTAVSRTEAASVEISADTGKAKAEIAGLQAQIAGLTKLGAIGLGAGLLGGVAVLGGSFAIATNAAADFEGQLSALQAVSNVTGDELAALRQQALDAGADTVFSASEAALAQTELAKAGATTAQILGGGLPAALALASAGEIELADAATFVAQGLNTFGLEAEDSARVADVLAAAANKSAADIPSIGLALQQSGLVAKSFGLTIEETSGILALFSQNGLQGSDAGTSFKTMLQRLNPQSEEAAGLMKELGLNFYDAQGSFVGIESVATQLQDSLSGLTEEQRNAALQTLFGADAIRAANLLYAAGGEGVAEWTSAVTDSGFASEVAATKLDNLKGDLEALKGSFETVFIEAGSGAQSGLRDVVQSLTGVVNTVGPAFQQMLAPVADLIETLAPLLAELGLAAVPVLTTLGELAGPVLEGLVGILVSLMPYADQFLEALKPLAPIVFSILEAFSPLLPILGSVAEALLAALIPALGAFADPDLAEAIISLAESFAEILIAVAPLLPILVKLAVPLVTIVAKIAAFEPLLTAVVAGLVAYKVATAAATLATTLFSTASAGFALNPIGLAVAAVVALGAGVFVAYKKIEPFRRVVDGIGRFFRDDFLPTLIDVGKAVGRFLVGAFEKAQEIFAAVFPVAKRLFGIFVKIQLGPILKLGQALAALFTGDFSGFADRIREALLIIPEALGDLASMILPVLSDVGEWLVTEGVPLLARKYVELWEAIFRFVLDAYPKAVGFLLELLGKIGSWILFTAVPFVAEKAASLVGAFLGWLVESIVTLPLKLAEFGLNLLAWIIGVPIWLAYEGGKIGIAFLAWLNDAIAALPGKLLEVASAVLNWIVTTAPVIAERVVELATSFIGWAVQVASELPGKLAEIAGSIVSWLAELPGKIIEAIPAIVEAAAGIGSAILEGIGQGITAAVDFIGDVAGAIWTAVKDFINEHVIDPIRTYSVKIDPPGPGVLYEGEPFGSFPRLARGGLIETPTLALVGEAGPELVLPLGDPARMADLLREAGLLGPSGLAAAVAGGAVAAPSVGSGADGAAQTQGGADPAALALGGSTEELEAWVAESVAILAALGKQIQDASDPGMVAWRDRVREIFLSLDAEISGFTDRTVYDLQLWATSRIPTATLSPLQSWAAQLVSIASGAAASMAYAWGSGIAVLAPLAARAAADTVAGMATGLSTGTAKVSTITSSYARELAGALNPVLKAVGSPELRLARGGLVPGPNVERDVVPALLMPGEVVIRKASVESFGLGQLLHLNEHGRLPGFRDGGVVTGDTAGLHPEFLSRLHGWSAAVGRPYHVGDGYRSPAESNRLYADYLAGRRSAPAAPGGRSMHNFGLASDGNHWSALNPAAWGLRFPMSYEPWHVEPVEARAWAQSMRDGVIPGLKPIPELPKMPNKGAIAETALAAMAFAREAALEWASTRTFSAVEGPLGTIGGGGAAAAAGWIRQAMALTGVPDRWFEGLMTIARRESNFDPMAYNGWDSNAAKGQASRGLMQTIPATFAAFALPGMTNIFDPVHNAVAAIRYILARYGDIANVQQANPNLPPKGYRDGGLVGPDGIHPLAGRMASADLALASRPGGSAGGGGGSGRSLTIQGDVNMNVTPPAAEDPESYGMALSHRVVPSLSAVLARLG